MGKAKKTSEIDMLFIRHYCHPTKGQQGATWDPSSTFYIKDGVRTASISCKVVTRMPVQGYYSLRSFPSLHTKQSLNSWMKTWKNTSWWGNSMWLYLEVSCVDNIGDF